jgi:dihydrofolate reductase
MAKLIYSAIASLDGYVEDEEGNFGWAAPDEEVHGFVNDLERGIGTYLLGRRMYETMAVWQTPEVFDDPSPIILDFAQIWQAAEKVVYSRTLEEPATPRTRLEREFDPAAVRQLKESADRDLGIGGAEVAGQALAAGLIDECQLLLVPVAVGAGKPALAVGARLELDLLEQRRFENGTVFLHYAVAS